MLELPLPYIEDVAESALVANTPSSLFRRVSEISYTQSIALANSREQIWENVVDLTRVQPKTVYDLARIYGLVVAMSFSSGVQPDLTQPAFRAPVPWFQELVALAIQRTTPSSQSSIAVPCKDIAVTMPFESIKASPVSAKTIVLGVDKRTAL